MGWSIVSDVPAEADASADGLLGRKVREGEEGRGKEEHTTRMMMAVIQTQRES